MNWKNRLFQEQVIWQYPGHGPHAVFTLSDKHSNSYFNSDHLSDQSSLLEEACSYLYENAIKKIDYKPDWVITYAPYGLQIGSCLAKLFDTKFAYTESDNPQEINFNLQHGETALLCADDLHTGTRMHNLIKTVTAKQIEIVGPLLFVVNYSGKNKFNNREVASLIDLDIDVWSPDECPLCKSGSPALLARKNWQTLCSPNRQLNL